MLITLSLFLAVYQLGGHLSLGHVDYCDKNMCPHQGQHVACGETEDFGPACQGLPQLINLDNYKELILEHHNLYRSRVAAGKLKCFYPARRMAVVHWDDELAKTAEYNARRCEFAHDQCRSTKLFPMAGQNIYMTKTKYTQIPTEGFIKEAIFLWFEEQYYANHSVIASFRKTVPQTGHFTLLVSDRQNRVGCAFLRVFQAADPTIARDKDRVYIIFVCNYSMTNIVKCPSYKAGPPAADCLILSEKYEALCEDDIDPNDLKYYKRS